MAILMVHKNDMLLRASRDMYILIVLTRKFIIFPRENGRWLY